MSSTPTTPSTPGPREAAMSRLGAAYDAVRALGPVSDESSIRVAYFMSGYAPEAYLRALTHSPEPQVAAAARELLATLEQEWPDADPDGGLR